MQKKWLKNEMKIDKQIGVFYPAAFPQKEKMESGLKNLKANFKNVIEWKPVKEPYRYLARKPDDILDEFLYFNNESNAELLIAARGGAGVLFLVNKLVQHKTSFPKDTPVVIVSTEASQSKIDEFMKQGATSYITKPFTPETIRNTIKDILGETYDDEFDDFDEDLDF